MTGDVPGGFAGAQAPKKLRRKRENVPLLSRPWGKYSFPVWGKKKKKYQVDSSATGVLSGGIART